MTQTLTRGANTSTSTGLLRSVQILSALSVLSVLFQYVTAGQLFPDGGPEKIHAAGAIVLHIITGLAAIAAVLWARQDRSQLKLAVLAVVVFGATFVQAATGGRMSLWIHVPGAMILAAGVVWLLLASLRRTATTP